LGFLDIASIAITAEPRGHRGAVWLLILLIDALFQKRTVKIERDGKTYTATWRVEKGILTVSTAPGSREAPVGDSEPEDLARKVLSEMISSD